MIRPSITVVMKDDTRYDANHLAIVNEPRFRQDADTRVWLGEGCALTFVCSGRLMSKPAEQVERIEYHEPGADWCDTCDGPIDNVQGAGPFANPAPLS